MKISKKILNDGNTTFTIATNGIDFVKIDLGIDAVEEFDFKRLEYLMSRVQSSINKGVFLPSETSFACADCPYKSRCRSCHLV